MEEIEEDEGALGVVTGVLVIAMVTFTLEGCMRHANIE